MSSSGVPEIQRPPFPAAFFSWYPDGPEKAASLSLAAFVIC